jgi:Na+/H+-dicarboxylate symporter
MFTKQKNIPLALQIFIALILAVIVGLLMQKVPDIATAYIKPFGTIFLNLIKFIVGPIVLFSIMAGIVSMRDLKKLGAIGGTTLIYYFFTTAIAISIGLVFASLFKGAFPTLSTSSLTYAPTQTTSMIDTFVNMFPANFIVPISSANMLQVIVMAILIGFAVIQLGEKAEGAITTINRWNDIFLKCMEMILKLSPIGVFCLLAPVIALNGAAVIGSLAKVLLCAYICYILHAVIVYSFSVSVLGGVSPLRFFKEMAPAIVFAFSSASSVGTLPLNMKCTRKLGVSKEISSFVLPLGATINMDGTAIYQGVCAIFIAACYGIDLTFAQMISIVLTATLASVGTAGVPGAGVVMLALILTSAGLPVDGIALVAGVDRIFDMGRTTLNITGDASCTLIVSNLMKKREGKLALKNQQ